MLLRKVLLSGLTAMLFGAVGVAQAGYVFFDNSAGTSDYATAANWDTNVLPTAGDWGIIDGHTATVASDVSAYVPDFLILGDSASGSLVVNTGASLSIGECDIGYGASGSLLLAGGTLTTSSEVYVGHGFEGTGAQTGGTFDLNGSLKIGYGGTGTFTMSGGTLETTGFITLGYSDGATGTLTVEGDSVMTIGGGSDLSIAEKGQTTGTMYIKDNAAISVAAAMYVGRRDESNAYLYQSGGSLTVNGITSIGGRIAKYGTDTVGVYELSGGSFTTKSTLYLGCYSSSSSGTIEISNGAEMSVSGLTYLGYTGVGVIEQSSGTTTLGNSLYIGYLSGSNGTFTLSGGTVEAGNTAAGYYGSATVTLSGGEFTTGDHEYFSLAHKSGSSASLAMSNDAILNVGGDMTIAEASSSIVVATLSDNVALNVNEKLYVGRLENATGTLIQSGGAVSVVLDVNIGRKVGAIGTYTMTGGSLAVGDDIIVGDEGTGFFSFSNGTKVSLDINDPLVEEDVYGQFLGMGELTLGGELELDLADVTVDSGVWELVATTLTTSYEPTFSLTTADGGLFTESGNVWTYNDWSFSEATGVLSKSVVPEPSTLVMLVAGLFGLIAYAWRKRK